MKKRKRKKRQEGFDNAKMDLRMKFILDSISEHEELKFDENEAARELLVWRKLQDNLLTN